jgi:hypothetical protein
LTKAAESPYKPTLAQARTPISIKRNVEVKTVAKTSTPETATVQSTPAVNVEAGTVLSISEANAPVENVEVATVQPICESNAAVENVKDVGCSDKMAANMFEGEGGMQLMDGKEEEDSKGEVTAELVGESMPVTEVVETKIAGEAGQEQIAEVIPSCQIVQAPVSREMPEEPPSETSATETESQDTGGSFPIKAQGYTTCMQGCVDLISFFKSHLAGFR